jgi:flagellar basal-body rod protein FlgB
MQWVDRVFGVSPQVLSVRSQRFEMIAANLANADTPGYKARDMDFSSALAAAGDSAGASKMFTTNPQHIEVDAGGMSDVAKYRVPMQPSMDGNTVESDVERSAFMDNSIRYQASLNFLNSRIKGILGALRGE